MVRGEHDVGGPRAEALGLPYAGTVGQVLTVEANGGVAGNPKAASSMCDELGVALPQGLSK